MEQPALWSDDDWYELLPVRDSESGRAYLQSVVALAPPAGATLDDVITRVLMPPRSWREATYFSNVSMTDTTETLLTALQAFGHRAAAGVDFDFVPDSSTRLSTRLGNQVHERYTRRFGSAGPIRFLWVNAFTVEQSITNFVASQININILTDLPSLLFQPTRGEFMITGEVQSTFTDLGNSYPDMHLGFDLGKNHSIKLMGGEIKKEVVASLTVLRWMVWILTHEPLSLFLGHGPIHVDGDQSRTDKRMAWCILRQVWLQQVVNRLNFMFLTNGDDYLFFRAGTENKTEILASRIYRYDGATDAYDGSILPSLWTGAPMEVPALRPFRAIMSLCCQSDELSQTDDPQTWAWLDQPEFSVSPSASASTGSEPKSDPDSDMPPPGVEGSKARTMLSRTRHVADRLAEFSSCQLATISIDDRVFNRGIHRLWFPLLLGPFKPIRMDSNVEPAAADNETNSNKMGSRQLQMCPSRSLPRGIRAGHLDSYASSGAYADGYAGRLRARRQELVCFFKIVRSQTYERALERPCTPHEALPRLASEARTLLALKDTGATPYPYGAWFADELEGGQIGLIAMELCGGSAKEGTDEEDKRVIIETLDKLHAAGYAHGDLSLRHIVRKLDRSGKALDHQWVFIDLERAVKMSADSMQLVKEEKATLRGLLHQPAPQRP